MTFLLHFVFFLGVLFFKLGLLGCNSHTVKAPTHPGKCVVRHHPCSPGKDVSSIPEPFLLAQRS